MTARGVPCPGERRKTRARTWSGCARAPHLAMEPAPTRRQYTAQSVASGSAMLTPRMSIGTLACCLNGSGGLRHMLNLSDVLTYLMSWQNGQTNLRILLSTGDGRFSFDCTLLGFSDTGISLQLSGDSNSIDLNLVGYDFEFQDESAANIPREETPAHPIYVRGLRANRGPGETLFILEVAAS